MRRAAWLIALLALGSCGHRAVRTAAVPEPLAAGEVEVLSFHAERRCATCLAIEQLTREVVGREFATELADSTLRLRVVDIAREEALADHYEVAWSSLLLRGSDTMVDLTRFAFDNVRRDPEAFKTRLAYEIDKLLHDE